ncbi:hypothetical protein F5887DRAFT_989014, partial [Amanita rubescens]
CLFLFLLPSTLKMSTVRLVTSFFIYAQLLPLPFLLHIFCLCATALWTGTPMASIIQDILVMEYSDIVVDEAGQVTNIPFLHEVGEQEVESRNKVRFG